MKDLLHRRAAASDTEGIIKCILSAYGPDAYNEEYYDPAYISGRIGDFFVSETGGRVVGILAVSPFGRAGEDREFSTFVVDRDFKGFDIGGGLLKSAIDDLERNKVYDQIKGTAVTLSHRTQELMLAVGFKFTGYLHGYVDARPLAEAKGLKTQKQSVIIGIREFQSAQRAPHRHCEERSDAAIQCSGSLCEPGLLRGARNDDGGRNDDCVWHTHNPQFHTLEIYFKAGTLSGISVADEVRKIEAKYAHDFLTSNVMIDTHDPNAEKAAADLLNDKGIEAGMMTKSGGADYKIIHRPHKVQLHTEEFDLLRPQ
jgi:N-acetylglutamate synthase-like GNAT family acetyltransferase